MPLSRNKILNIKITKYKTKVQSTKANQSLNKIHLQQSSRLRSTILHQNPNVYLFSIFENNFNHIYYMSEIYKYFQNGWDLTFMHIGSPVFRWGILVLFKSSKPKPTTHYLENISFLTYLFRNLFI